MKSQRPRKRAAKSSRNYRDPPVNPLAIPLFAGLAAVLLAVVYELTGYGKEFLHWALAIAVLYGGTFVFTMAVGRSCFGVLASQTERRWAGKVVCQHATEDKSPPSERAFLGADRLQPIGR